MYLRRALSEIVFGLGESGFKGAFTGSVGLQDRGHEAWTQADSKAEEVLHNTSLPSRQSMTTLSLFGGKR